MTEIRAMRGSILLKLMAAFLLVIVVVALVVYFLTMQATQNAFRLYTTQNGQLWADRLAPTFAEFYAQSQSWRGVDVFIATSLPMMPMDTSSGMMRGQGRGMQGGMAAGWMGGMDQRLILADARGVVIADSASSQDGEALIGTQLSAAELAGGAPVSVGGRSVGTLIVTPGEQRSGSNPGATFLSTVQRSIVISVGIAGLVGVLLVSLFFFQITAPLRQMQRAASAIARGDLSQRVPVGAKDELGHLAETFNQMAGSLAQAEALRQKLLADVAHELRTPLAVIQANTEGMQDGVLPLDLEQINTIHAETLMLARLINDLRLISLAESGELRLERHPAQIGALLQMAVDRFQPQCAQKAVELSCVLEDSLPPVNIDVDRINQVLNNLISNALRYTPEGGQIILRAEQGPDSSIQVSVSDSGPGISSEDLPWVFDRFYRADKSRARASGGSGLGLAIVKQLVEAHGGAVKAESPADGGRGARIVFTVR